MNRSQFNKLKHVMVAGAVLCLLTLGGCASVPMATPEQDAAAKKFTVPPGKSRIYLYRNETFGGAITIAVALDGKLMASTGPMTYFVWDVDPGQHTILSKSENDATLTLNTVAGQPYFVWQEIKLGVLTPRSLLHKVDIQTGEKAVLECKLGKSAP